MGWKKQVEEKRLWFEHASGNKESKLKRKKRHLNMPGGCEKRKPRSTDLGFGIFMINKQNVLHNILIHPVLPRLEGKV